jgi:hypothetical protein
MNRIEKTISIALFFFFAGILNLVAVPLAPYTLTSNDLTINADGLITQCSYNFSNTNIIIPSSVKGRVITGVADGLLFGVFENKGITTLSLPETFTKIGIRAFKENKIKNINISNLTSLTQIGSSAFSGNSMTYLELPINSNANFTGWRDSEGNQLMPNAKIYTLARSYQAIIAYRLTNSDVQVTPTGEITTCNYLFSNTDIIIPDTLDGFVVKSIKNSMLGPFCYKAITSVKLPQTIKRIGDYAFTGNNINTVYFNNLTQLEEIGRDAFSFSSIKKVYFETCTALKHIEPFAFEHNSITAIDLSSCTALQIIDSLAFCENSINTINLSNCNQLSELRYNAFSTNSISTVNLTDCTNLLSINRPFQYNIITYYTLPASIRFGFEGWDGGVEVKQPGEQASVDFFYSAIAPYILTNDDVTVSNGYIRFCTYNFSNKRIRIPEILDGVTIKGISYMCEDFQNKDIKKIYFPSTLQVIDQYTLSNNEISSLDFSNCPNLAIIGMDAFENNSIQTINFSGCNSLKHIYAGAFRNNSIDTLDFAGCDSLDIIGTNAFRNCSIQSVKFGACKSLEKIWDHAFCNNLLSEVDLSGCTNLTMIANDVFTENELDGFRLPTPSKINFYKWVSSKGDTIDSETFITDLSLTYEATYLHFLSDDELVIDEEGTIVDCNYNFNCKYLYLPDSVNGQPVRGIGANVFQAKGLVRIRLPKTIEIFEPNCFNNNRSLGGIDLRQFTQLRKLGYASFASTMNLLILPQNTSANFYKWISEDSYGTYYEPGDTITEKYNSYSALFSHTLSDTDTEIDSTGKITACSAEIIKKVVIIPDTINGKAVKSINHATFFRNEAYKFIFPSSLQEIYSYAFFQSYYPYFDLSNVESLRFIGTRAFASQYGTTLVLPEITDDGFIGWRDGKGNFFEQLETIEQMNTYYIAISNESSVLSVKYNNCDTLSMEYFNLDQTYYSSDNEYNEFIFKNIQPGEHQYSTYKKGYNPIRGTIDINGPYTYLSIDLEQGYLEGSATVKHDSTPQFGDILSIDTTHIITNIPHSEMRVEWYAIDELTGITTAKSSSPSFTIREGDIGMRYFYTVSSFCCYNNTIISSDTTQVVGKASVAPPAPPILASKIAYSVLLVEGEGLEYSIVGSSWHDSPFFTGLFPGTDYYFVQRYAETATHNASPASNVLMVTTDDANGIPLSIYIEERSFGNFSNECFSAVQTIVVADSCNLVVFQNGSNTNLVAGQSIRFLPGTVIEPGAYVHAYITTDGSFCDNLPEAIVAANNTTEKSIELADVPTDELTQEATLKVFPNPSDGRFTIQTTGFEGQSDVVIYNNTGAVVFETQLSNGKTLELFNLRKGIYIVKAVNSKNVLSQRMIIR